MVSIEGISPKMLINNQNFQDPLTFAIIAIALIAGMFISTNPLILEFSNMESSERLTFEEIDGDILDPTHPFQVEKSLEELKNAIKQVVRIIIPTERVLEYVANLPEAGSGPENPNNSGSNNEDKTIFISPESGNIIRVFDYPSLILEKNQSPIAKLQAEGIYVVYETIGFSAAGSSDPDGNIIDYHWDFGDGTEGFGAVVSHQYQYAGTYTVTLNVIDDFGKSASDSIEFFVSPKIAYRVLLSAYDKSMESSFVGNIMIEEFFGKINIEKSSMNIDLDGDGKINDPREYALDNLNWKEITLVEIAVQYVYDPYDGKFDIRTFAFQKSYDSEEDFRQGLSAYTHIFN